VRQIGYWQRISYSDYKILHKCVVFIGFRTLIQPAFDCFQLNTKFTKIWLVPFLQAAE